MLAMAARQLRSQVPDTALRQRLTPTYPLGCKRLIYSNDYLPALGLPHTELVTDAIAAITPQGIVTADGRERPVDALVCAPGVETVQLLATVDVLGLGGRECREEAPVGCHHIDVESGAKVLVGPVRESSAGDPLDRHPQFAGGVVVGHPDAHRIGAAQLFAVDPFAQGQELSLHEPIGLAQRLGNLEGDRDRVVGFGPDLADPQAVKLGYGHGGHQPVGFSTA